jgi:two-component system, sensor histidine kinase RegB
MNRGCDKLPHQSIAARRQDVVMLLSTNSESPAAPLPQAGPESAATAGLQPAAGSSAINLRRLVILRTLAMVGLALVMLIAVRWLEILLPIEPIVLLLAGAAVINLLTWLRLNRAWPVHDLELFGHLVFDVLLLTALLYFAGGSTNPFTPLFLLPLTLAAAALSWRYTWPVLLLATTCYSLLLVYYQPLLHSHRGAPVHVLDDFKVHVVGTWLGFLLSGSLIAYFAVRMRETVRERDALRARMREQELRHERLLALGTFAAGAAHELGTPLATIAVLCKELTRGEQHDAARLRTLREQVDRCKSILGSLAAAVGHPRAEDGSATMLDVYLHDLLSGWQTAHPHLDAQIQVHGAVAAPRIVTDVTLRQALLNVLNNAAEVSSAVEVDARWDHAALTIEVRDRGPGLSAEAQEHVGEPFFTTKVPGAGMGLGLFLARGALERCGGNLTLTNREGGGALCRMHLPFDHYRVAQP